MVTDTQHIKPFYVVLYITVTTTKKNWRRRKKDMGTKNQFLRISLNQIIFNVCVQQKYCCCLSFWRLSSCYFCFFAWELSYPLQVLQCWQLLALWKLCKIYFWQIMTFKLIKSDFFFRVVVRSGSLYLN